MAHGAMVTSAPEAAAVARGDAPPLAAVAYLVSRYPGISHTFIQREIVELRRLGVRVETFTIRPVPGDELLTDFERDEAARTVAILPVSPARLLRAHLRAAAARPAAYASTLTRALRLSPGGLRGTLWQLFYFAEAILLEAELARRGIRHIHVHFANVSADVALLACRYSGGRIRWSFTMHGSTEFYDVEQHRLRAKIESATTVPCVSDFTRSQMMRSVSPEHWHKLVVVRCGIDSERFVADAPDPAPGVLRVLFVGRLVAAKGTSLLLEAVAELRRRGREVSLVLVGDGPDRERLEALAARDGIADAVEFAGAVGQDRIRDHYAACDVFCLPSFAEGVPVVLMEAMAMRRPVVTTGIMGVPELVEHDVSGLLVAPGRADALVDALERLITEPDLVRRLGEAGRERVVREFDLARSVDRLAAVLAAVEPRGVA